MYKKPKQTRAVITEQKFLDALSSLLSEKSLNKLTIEEISERATLHRGAFLKRFGSKRQALLVLFERYCFDASACMSSIQENLQQYSNALDVCNDMSKQLEHIQKMHFASNRAMHEIFLDKLEIDEQTKQIFKQLVKLMKNIQKKFLSNSTASDLGAYSAAQILVTTNYNYVLLAMPGLPRAPEIRHDLIGKIVLTALKI